jgi:hypothetical protein
MLRRRCAGCLVCQWEDIAAAADAIDLRFPGRSRAGVTGKSSLAAADAPAGTQTARVGRTSGGPAGRRGLVQPANRRELEAGVKAVGFHLGHIFGKLGIRSRTDLIDRFGTPLPHTRGNLGS